MPQPKTPVLWLLLWLSAGILAGYYLKPSLLLCLLLLLCSLLVLIPAYWKMGKAQPWLQAFLIGFGFLVLGVLTVAIRLPENNATHFVQHWESGKGNIRAHVIKKLRASQWSQPFLAEVQRLQPPLYRGKVLLKIPRDSTHQLPAVGDQLLLWGEILPIGPPLNPYQFDYSEYMRKNGVCGQLQLKPGGFLRIDGKSKGKQSLGTVRDDLAAGLSETGLDASALGLFRALILGDRTELDAGLYRSYQRAGAAHILAVSGLHIGILAGMLYWFLKPLARRLQNPWPVLLIILSGLWGYAALSGLSPSVVRASLLFSFLSIGQAFKRPGFSLHFLGLAGIFMLSINPLWLLDVGFQLSFAAVASILVFFKPLMELWPWKKGVLGKTGGIMAVSIAAQAGVLPFSLYYFHQFPGIFLASNLLLIPGLGLLLLLGFVFLGLSVLGCIPEFLTTLYGQLLSLMNASVRILSNMDAFFFEDIRWDLPASIFLVLMLLGLAALRFRNYRWFISLSIAGVFSFLGWNLYSVKQDQSIREFCIPHKVAASGFWLRQQGKLDLYGTDSLAFTPLLEDLKDHVRIDQQAFLPLQNSYSLAAFKLLIIDSSGVYPCPLKAPDLLWLRESPKIHLERVLAELNPKLLLVDGSNYKSDISRWEKSCKKMGIPLHVTASDGAFRLNL
ncbi:ComEC/Rec2 family competence protein [Robiginitalea sp. IMCC43444]|uniref:ComEC/Rec2 family competence protein n=1 Tax=Robiginitalea sp. IMCC43444 TaxID=3459121 RepID=UPI00404107B3